MAATMVGVCSPRPSTSSPHKLQRLFQGDCSISRSISMRLFVRVVALAMPGLLAGCMSSPKPVPALDAAALPVMERVAMGAHRCWFKSGDPAFAPYKLAMELNSYSGTPRILLVKKHAPETRPLLVVQANGAPAKLDAFGPLMSEPAFSARVRKDVNGWARGGRLAGSPEQRPQRGAARLFIKGHGKLRDEQRHGDFQNEEDHVRQRDEAALHQIMKAEAHRVMEAIERVGDRAEPCTDPRQTGRHARQRAAEDQGGEDRDRGNEADPKI
eukprot:gene15495-20538_t